MCVGGWGGRCRRNLGRSWLRWRLWRVRGACGSRRRWWRQATPGRIAAGLQHRPQPEGDLFEYPSAPLLSYAVADSKSRRPSARLAAGWRPSARDRRRLAARSRAGRDWRFSGQGQACGSPSCRQLGPETCPGERAQGRGAGGWPSWRRRGGGDTCWVLAASGPGSMK